MRTTDNRKDTRIFIRIPSEVHAAFKDACNGVGMSETLRAMIDQRIRDAGKPATKKRRASYAGSD